MFPFKSAIRSILRINSFLISISVLNRADVLIFALIILKNRSIFYSRQQGIYRIVFGNPDNILSVAELMSK
jgi:hypothetical protein